MKGIKILLGALLLLICVGCGASVKYTLDIDTAKETILLEIILEVTENDYQYIEGGRDALIDIINNKKPKELEFSISESNSNEYCFSITFNSYEEYAKKYYAITGEESKNIFDVGEFSKESPFIAEQEIEIIDDMSNFLKWLKEELVSSGAVSVENGNKLISSQNYYYIFDGNENYANQKYSGKTHIPIEQVNVECLVKQNNKLDFTLNLIIEKENIGTFSQDFKEFIEDKNIDVEYTSKQTKYDKKECNIYTVVLSNIDLNDKDSLKAINIIFGENFCNITELETKDSSLFKNQYKQFLKLELNFNSLFNLNYTNIANVTLDIKDVELDQEFHSEDAIPKKTVVENGYYSTTLHTRYSAFIYLNIACITVVITLIGFIIRKLGIRKCLVILQDFGYKGYNYVYDKIFESSFELQNYIITSKNFLIDIGNINNIEYGRKQEEVYKACINIALLTLCFPVYQMLSKFLAIAMFIGIIGYIFICLLKYRTKSLHIQLSSGKTYSFVFEDDGKARSIYLELLEKLDKTQQIDIEEIIYLEESIEE